MRIAAKARRVARRRNLSVLRVFASVSDRRKGYLVAGGAVFPCALGRSGIRTDKREGDGGTPRAALPLRSVLFRADRHRPPAHPPAAPRDHRPRRLVRRCLRTGATTG